jgi:hypothetical protein
MSLTLLNFKIGHFTVGDVVSHFINLAKNRFSPSSK